MSEARQHNTEILLAIEKVAHRMDQLTCKVYLCNTDLFVSVFMVIKVTNKILQL